MLKPTKRPVTSYELAALSRRALGSVLGDLIEIAGTDGKAGARARGLLKDVAGVIVSDGGAAEKTEAADGGDSSLRLSNPAI